MKLRAVLALLALSSSCGTGGDPAHGDENLPTAGVGPFRALEKTELRGAAPFVLDDPTSAYGDPAALQDGSDTLLYVVVTGGKIARTRSIDGRTFFRPPKVVLDPSEGETALAAPAVLRRGGETLLYYAASDGIGVARGDGLVFRKEPAKLAGSSPTVFALPNGELRMMYTVSGAIEEAKSSDGIAWSRIGVVLSQGADPFALVHVSADRLVVQVLYTRPDGIGYAARFGEEGALTPQDTVVYPGGKKPALVTRDGVSFLYVEQDHASALRTYSAIAAAIAPGRNVLSTPVDAPPTP